ncbi:MAG TPA: O-antigen ligase family protein [Candidatus Acidoferrales bacterium]|nr:O-antigen ligase family protein [Candidatus Acidoferrales bacterium]
MIVFYLLVVSLPFALQPWFARPIGPLTVEKLLGAACALYAMVHLAAKRRIPRLFSTLEARSFLVFVALAAASWAAMRTGPASDDMMSVYASHFVFFVVLLAVVDTPGRLRLTLLAAIAGIGWASLYVLREWQVQTAIYGTSFRPGYVTGDSNFFTASAVLVVPLAALVLQRDQSRLARLFTFGCLAAALVAIVVGASRGGFVGLVAGILWMLWRAPRRGRNLAILGTLLAVFLALAPSSPLKRFLHPDSGDLESEQIHLRLWAAAWRIIQAHPLTGIGVGNFKYEVAGYTSHPDLRYMAHNTYLEISSEMGLPGLLAFLLMFFSAIVSYGRLAREAERTHDMQIAMTANGAQAGLVGFGVAALFVSAEFLRMFWFLLFLAMCLGPLRRAQSEHAAEPVGAEASAAEPSWPPEPEAGTGSCE